MEAINISDWTIDGNQIADMVMEPGDYVVLARNKTAFDAYYGALSCPVIDVTFVLANSGDTIVLENSTGAEVDNVTYDASWGADGNGKTLERTATGDWAESTVDGGTPCAENSETIVIPFSSWPSPMNYISNSTVDKLAPENVGKNASTGLFTATEMIDNESYSVVSIRGPMDITKIYISLDEENEDYLLKRTVEVESGVEILNLTFDPAVVMWDFPLEAEKSWTSTANVTGIVNETGVEIPINGTAVVSSKVTADVVTAPLGAFSCLVIENNISFEVAGQQITNSNKHWICQTEEGIMCPKIVQSFDNGELVEEQELIEIIPPTYLNESDNNTTINATTGEFLVVSLEGNPTTGYTWEVEELNEQVLQQVGDIAFVQDYAEPGFVGVPGVQIATFEVVGAGNATINMVYHQPWETDVEPADTFTLDVTAN